MTIEIDPLPESIKLVPYDPLTMLFEKVQELVARTNDMAKAVDELIETKDRTVGKVALLEQRLERHAKNINTFGLYGMKSRMLNVDEEPDTAGKDV